MSIKISDLKELVKKMTGMTPEELLKHLEEQFFHAYGRYENASNTLFFEMYHAGDADKLNEGAVVFRKGRIGVNELEEDLIIPRKEAYARLKRLASGGFSRVFEAVTADEMDEKRHEHFAAMSTLAKENRLGLYRNGKYYFRLNQFGQTFSFEYGYGSIVKQAKHDLTESEATAELENALAQGYSKDGLVIAQPATTIDSSTFFDLPEAQEKTVDVLENDPDAPDWLKLFD